MHVSPLLPRNDLPLPLLSVTKRRGRVSLGQSMSHCTIATITLLNCSVQRTASILLRSLKEHFYGSVSITSVTIKIPRVDVETTVVVFVDIEKNDRSLPQETATEGGTLEAPLLAHRSPTLFAVIHSILFGGLVTGPRRGPESGPSPDFPSHLSASWRIQFLDPVLISLSAGRYVMRDAEQSWV
jgi:hypothetical protein